MSTTRCRSRSPRSSCPEGKEDIVFGPGGYDFSCPGPLPPSAQKRVQELLESGRLFRYQGGVDDVANLEREFTSYIGLPFTMACNSGGCGIFLSLKALGVKPGDKVLLNAWTLAPVPGAIVHASATPVAVAVDPGTVTINVEDLDAKARESGAKVLVLSYMRGHIPNIDEVFAVVKRHGLAVVEDCAHTLGATWVLNGESEPRHIGAFGDVAVWSLQTNKSINCGEGGLISTARQDLAAFITIATGSYGHFRMNGASGDAKVMDEMYTSVPNMSMRLSATAAAIAAPQVGLLAQKLKTWESHAISIRNALQVNPHVRIFDQALWKKGKLVNVWSSIQFELVDFSDAMIEELIKRLSSIEIPLAWFGGAWKGFTSTWKDWKFADPDGTHWNEKLDKATKKLVDLPLYHTTSWSSAVIGRLSELLTETITSVADSHKAEA